MHSVSSDLLIDLRGTPSTTSSSIRLLQHHQSLTYCRRRTSPSRPYSTYYCKQARVLLIVPFTLSSLCLPPLEAPEGLPIDPTVPIVPTAPAVPAPPVRPQEKQRSNSSASSALNSELSLIGVIGQRGIEYPSTHYRRQLDAEIEPCSINRIIGRQYQEVRVLPTVVSYRHRLDRAPQAPSLLDKHRLRCPF